MAQLLPETLVIDAFCARRHEELLETLSAARATTEQILRELPRALRIVRIQATIGAGAETETCQMLNEVTGATWYARTLRGLCMKSDLCEYFDIVETTHTHAVAIYKRVGRPERVVKTTLDDANKRGLIVKGNKWDVDPLSMCVADVERRGARLGWPEIVSGLYTPDEIELGMNESGIQLLDVA